MKHTYQITGMTCDGCKKSVTEKLSAVEGVTSVAVHLEKGEATLAMEHHIPTKVLQEALPQKYTLSEKKSQNVFSTTEMKQPASKLQQLKPLFLIFAFLLGASILLHFKQWDTTQAMLDFMGLFYIVFSFFKLLDVKGFAESFQMYDPLAKRVPVYGLVYPFIELALGILFLMRVEIGIALIVTLVILGLTTIGVTKVLVDKKAIRCACLGTALNLPMTEATFIENALMIVMALLMLLKIV
ncbi:MAG: cation transporter [Flavobacteriaceae bacterium]